MDINKYLYQSDNLLNTYLECELYIDLINYENEDNIIIKKDENIIWVKSLISKIEFNDDESFDIILDYPIIIHADNMEIFDDYIKLKYYNNTTILESSLEIEDIKKRVGYTERLLGGKEVTRDSSHLLMKLYKEFQDTSIDLVHLEILVSNVLRDKDNVSIQARLNKKKYNPTLINFKDIVFHTSFLQSLAFENIGKSIKIGLISEVEQKDKNILEKVLTGTIVEKK